MAFLYELCGICLIAVQESCLSIWRDVGDDFLILSLCAYE